MNKKNLYISCLLSFWCVVVFARDNTNRKADVAKGVLKKTNNSFLETPSHSVHEWKQKMDIRNSSSIDPSIASRSEFNPRVRCQAALVLGNLEDALEGDCNWLGRQIIWQLGNGESVAYS